MLREIKRTFRSYSQLPADGSHMCALLRLRALPSLNPMTSYCAHALTDRSTDRQVYSASLSALDSSCCRQHCRQSDVRTVYTASV